MVRSMSVEAAFELLELLRDAGLSEQDEILTFTQRIERVEIPISAGSKNIKTRVSVETGRSGSASASIARLVPDDVRRGSVHKKAGFCCWSPASSRWKRTLSGWKRTLS
jgi:hypothetical protein